MRTIHGVYIAHLQWNVSVREDECSRRLLVHIGMDDGAQNICPMKNVSLNGEEIFLLKGKSYVIIDSLYLNDVRDKLQTLDANNLESDMRKKVFSFPRTDTPFIIISVASDNDVARFDISDIIKAHAADDRLKCFDCDSGLLMFIESSVLYDVIQHFDYNDLVDSITDPVSSGYWQALYENYHGYSLGLILAPGINSGYGFDGSGHYTMKESNSIIFR